jgi:predicted adenine nucleotide alpha hydrolase (AANH) superfamily ATPase
MNILSGLGPRARALFSDNKGPWGPASESEPEGGRRCLKCFALRLEETARRAKAEGFDYFTTTLSVSPHKDAQALGTIGGGLAEKYGVNYLFADFKKRNGYKRSIELSEKFGLYRQDYCGCRYSLAARRSTP